MLGSLIFVMLLSACSISPPPVRRVGLLDVGTAYRVAVQADTAFVASNDGVVVIDIHNRNRPKKIALIELNEAAFGVYAQENLVFIAGPADGLVIADVQDPASPKVIGTYAGSGINEICVQGGIAYATTQQGDLQLIDIENPTQPTWISTYKGGKGLGLMIACFQDVAYFSTSKVGMDVLDVSDPSNPVKATTVPTTQGAKDAQMMGDRLYLSCVGNGVRILDIVDPYFPQVITSFNNGGEAWGVGGDSHLLWIGDLQEGIEIYDLSNPQNPALIAQDSSYAPHDIFFDGEYAYLADQDQGFVILAYRGDD